MSFDSKIASPSKSKAGHFSGRGNGIDLFTLEVFASGGGVTY